MNWRRAGDWLGLVVAGTGCAVVVLALVVGPARGQTESGAPMATPTPTPTPCAGFLDVPGNDIFCPAISQINSLGIMQGCGSTYFCPGEFLMREDMAVHLEKLYRGASFSPCTPSTDPFNDVLKTYLLAGWIKTLASDGVTAGCSSTPPLYCPYGFVSRWQMAVFLSKVISWRIPESVPDHGTISGQWFNCTSTSYPPNPASVSLFADVAWNDGGCKFVHYIYAKNVTAGCGTNPLIFCPNTNVSRNQMAAFLKNSYNTIGGAPTPTATPCQ